MTALAEPNAVIFPPLDQLEQYTTVRRGVTREHMLTNQAALNVLHTDQPVPTGSHVVLVDCQSDVLHRYLVAQKMGTVSTTGSISGHGIAEFRFEDFLPKPDRNSGTSDCCGIDGRLRGMELHYVMVVARVITRRAPLTSDAASPRGKKFAVIGS